MTVSLAVVGSLMMDVTIRAPRLPRRGENLYVQDVVAGAGGKGANAAVTLARHGARVYLIGNVGADAWGDQVCGQLQETGVLTDYVGRDDALPTGTVVMVAEADGHTAYMAHTGANKSLTRQQVQGRLKPLLASLDGVFINFEPPEETLAEVVEMSHATGVPIFVDAGPERPYRSALWAGAAVVSPNESEVEALTGHTAHDEDGARAAAQALLSQGSDAVVLKLGRRGAYWVTESGAAFAPAFSISAIDAAGAGDAFTAGLTWAMLAGRALPEAVRWANACGALVAGRAGTLSAMPGREEVKLFLKSHSSSPP